MNRKKRRPAAPGRAHRAGTSKELGATFEVKISEESREPQDSVVPMVEARIVVGRRAAFLYIRSCVLCGLDHVHGYFVHGQGGHPLAAFAQHSGDRLANCHCQGPGRVARFVHGELRTAIRRLPEWREPRGHGYRLVLSDPACFTRCGLRSPAGRHAMLTLARRGVPTSLVIWTPRRPFFRGWGDR